MEFTVVIRTKTQLETLNPFLLEAFDVLIQSNKETPLIYQYLHNPNKELVIDSDNRIGTIKNVRKNKDGDIIGDVTICDIMKLASNFTGVIDNMVASLNEDTNKYEIDAFIIYNKEAKGEILGKRFDNSKFAKSGEVPIMVNTSIDEIKEVSNALLKAYENILSKQEDNENKED